MSMRTSSLSTFFRRALLAAAVVFTLGLSSPAVYAHETHLTTNIDALLDEVETVPTREAWLALGPEVAHTLRHVVNDPKELGHRRANALYALGFFPSPENRQVLERILNNERTTDTMRRGALHSLAVAYGEDVVPTLEVYVKHTNYHFRETAVRALSTIGTPRARLILEDRLDIEPSKNLKVMIRGGIQTIDEIETTPVAPVKPAHVHP